MQQFSLFLDKSPWPDGFTTGFYREAWHIIKMDVYNAVKDFFKHGKLLKEINATMITLVPKVDCPKTVGDYRPIACCNITYKIISKIITVRMQKVMNYLIDEAQGAFIKDRSIVDNVLVCQSIARGYQRRDGTPRCLMKLDLRKAYDTLNWKFIEAMLVNLNFPASFVQKIMVCVTTPRFSLMIQFPLTFLFFIWSTYLGFRMDYNRILLLSSIQSAGHLKLIT